jgi:hypothetical protein
MNATVVSLNAILAKSNASNASNTSNANTSKPNVSWAKTVPSAELARAFFAALRSAGMVTNDEGKRVRDPGMIRAHEVEAIKAFTGEYSVGGSHGSQLDAARTLAQRALAAGASQPVVKAYSRTSAPTVAGFVAGMPDHITKQKGILESLIRETVEEKCLAYAAKDSKKCATLDSQLTELRARLASLG